MSGGSFDYLYCAETLGSERTGDIERMAAELERLGHHDAAERTRTVLAAIAGRIRFLARTRGGQRRSESMSRDDDLPIAPLRSELVPGPSHEEGRDLERAIGVELDRVDRRHWLIRPGHDQHAALHQETAVVGVPRFGDEKRVGGECGGLFHALPTPKEIRI